MLVSMSVASLDTFGSSSFEEWLFLKDSTESLPMLDMFAVRYNSVSWRREGGKEGKGRKGREKNGKPEEREWRDKRESRNDYKWLEEGKEVSAGSNHYRQLRAHRDVISRRSKRKRIRGRHSMRVILVLSLKSVWESVLLQISDSLYLDNLDSKVGRFSFRTCGLRLVSNSTSLLLRANRNRRRVSYDFCCWIVTSVSTVHTY